MAERFELVSVPAFVFLRAGRPVDTLAGANAPALRSKLLQWASPPAAAPAEAGSSLAERSARLARLIRQAPVMVFMKARTPASC